VTRRPLGRDARLPRHVTAGQVRRGPSVTSPGPPASRPRNTGVTCRGARASPSRTRSHTRASRTSCVRGRLEAQNQVSPGPFTCAKARGIRASPTPRMCRNHVAFERRRAVYVPGTTWHSRVTGAASMPTTWHPSVAGAAYVPETCSIRVSSAPLTCSKPRGITWHSRYVPETTWHSRDAGAKPRAIHVLPIPLTTLPPKVPGFLE
jgi:hypothetical protein